MNKNKGFTLIELLVVIAIIGILASVVLASLNSARAKGADAAIKSNLNNIRAQAELVYDNANPNSYFTDTTHSVCTDPNVVKAITAAAKITGVPWSSAAENTLPLGIGCYATSQIWVATAPLKSQNVVGAATGIDYWCVDSSGNSTIEDDAVDTQVSPVTKCP